MADDQVQVVEVNVSDMAIELEGAEFYEQPVVYSFGGGKREFKDLGEDSSIYNP